MAVFTKLTKSKITEAIQAYNLEPIQSLKGFANGVENTTYGLMCGNETYILTLFERRVHANDIPFFVTLLNEQSAGGINCPKILISRNGEDHFFIDGKFF